MQGNANVNYFSSSGEKCIHIKGRHWTNAAKCDSAVKSIHHKEL